MTPRAKRPIAALAILGFLAAYIWAVIGLWTVLPRHWLLDLIVLGLAGIAWGLPVIPILKWAERP